MAGTEGNAVYIDGVALTAGEGSTTDANGSLQALLQLRDEVAPTFRCGIDKASYHGTRGDKAAEPNNQLPE